MKTDLDALMQENGLDALLITGPALHNPAMVYMTGGAHLTSGDLIKKRGETPVLFYNPMERDEAAKSGFITKNLAEYQFTELLSQANGEYALAYARRYQRMLDDCGIEHGKVALYGRSEIGAYYAILATLQHEIPGIELVGEINNSVMMLARMTKEAPEIERIRQMGKITTQVVGLVADYITSQHNQNGTLIKSNGDPLTIGDVKRKINLWLSERGAENPEDTIFAIGRDAGVPHSSGNLADPLRLGQTIVFDIYPCEAGGGYFYDFTRTWCLGYAPDEALAVYETVLSAYRQITSKLQAGRPFKDYQEMACDIFSAQGHPTIRENPQAQRGYVHSLGHGIGLNVHERPWSGTSSDDKDILVPGVVFTLEPGLYYPDQGMGVRLEDSLWVTPDGRMEVLADYPMDMVLPVRV
ncbi:MAG: aminopeptidase P family protein [Anaerolineales bacterium]|nr:aminopeptidase P family protein [Anaerolineae bacterium]PWB54136.1 MAG: aminopeptidase P family protein [Anaerolineales bacterium]